MKLGTVLPAMLMLCGRLAIAQDTASLAGSDAETSAALARIVATARARGLPTDPIVAKARFALVVHAPAARIIEAAQALAGRLEVARSAIASDTLSADITAGEEALSFKIPKDILSRIHRAAPDRSIAAPLGLLTQLVASHLPAERAGDIVIDLVRRGASPRQLAELGNDVNSDVTRGAKAMESADTRVHGLNPYLAPSGSGTVTGAPTAASGPKKP